MTGQDPTAVAIDTGAPHPARMYDCYLGGKDDYPADDAMAGRCRQSTPGCR